MSPRIGQAFLHIDDECCHVCRYCLAQQMCKVKTITRLDRGEVPFIDVHHCHGCMLCVVECPFEAIINA